MSDREPGETQIDEAKSDADEDLGGLDDDASELEDRIEENSRGTRTSTCPIPTGEMR